MSKMFDGAHVGQGHVPRSGSSIAPAQRFPGPAQPQPSCACHEVGTCSRCPASPRELPCTLPSAGKQQRLTNIPQNPASSL